MNKDIRPSIVICVFAALVCLLFAASARADDAPTCPNKALAIELDTKAGQAWDAGDHLGALESWQAAYKACQNPTTLWNIARSHEELKELTRARAFFVLHRDFPQLPEERIEATDQRLEDLTRALLAWEDIKEEADGHYASRSFGVALDQYKKAQDIQRTPDVMVRIAECLKATGELDQALAVLEAHGDFSTVSEIDTARVRKNIREIQAALIAQAEAAAGARPTSSGVPVVLSENEGDDNAGLKIAGWTTAATGVGFLIIGAMIPPGDFNDGNNNDGGGGGGGGRGGNNNNNDGQNFDTGGSSAARTGLFVAGGLLTLTGATLLTFGYLTEVEPESGPVEKVKINLGPTGVGIAGEF